MIDMNIAQIDLRISKIDIRVLPGEVPTQWIALLHTTKTRQGAVQTLPWLAMTAANAQVMVEMLQAAIDQTAGKPPRTMDTQMH